MGGIWKKEGGKGWRRFGRCKDIVPAIWNVFSAINGCDTASMDNGLMRHFSHLGLDAAVQRGPCTSKTSQHAGVGPPTGKNIYNWSNSGPTSK
eukprot:2211634-Pyramimonas_sp.AAC.1